MKVTLELTFIFFTCNTQYYCCTFISHLTPTQIILQWRDPLSKILLALFYRRGSNHTENEKKIIIKILNEFSLFTHWGKIRIFVQKFLFNFSSQNIEIKGFPYFGAKIVIF